MNQKVVQLITKWGTITSENKHPTFDIDFFDLETWKNEF